MCAVIIQYSFHSVVLLQTPRTHARIRCERSWRWLGHRTRATRIGWDRAPLVKAWALEVG